MLAVFFVAFAALLWGVDAVFQIPGLADIPGPELTFYEHLLGLIILLPFVARPSRREILQIRPRHLLPLFLLGIAGEALAGIFFGRSYRGVGPGAAGFLQMLQPFCVLAMVWALRRERNAASYSQWAVSVLLGAMVIWVFDPTFDAQSLEDARFWSAAGLGFLAVTLWAASNVSGKILLESFSPSSVVFMRWALSLVGLAVMLWLNSVPLTFRPFQHWASFFAILTHTSVLALLPLWIFYRGLKLIPASLATFVQLVCPLAAVFLPHVFGGKAIHELQWLGGISVLVGLMLLVRLELEFVQPKKRKVS